VLACAVGALLCGGAGAQTSTQVSIPGDLLPQHFGSWVMSSSAAAAPEPAMSLVNANKAALEECGPQRSQVASYVSGGRVLHVEAIQFGDYTGAWSAYTLIRPAGLRDTADLGSHEAAGDGAVLFDSGSVLVLAYPTTAADVGELKPLQAALPRATGSAAQAPLIPSFLPARALVDGSVRYALGAATYSAEGGVLPANSVGWDKSAEAITARYQDKRGDETLTLLLYPTPQIAEAHFKSVQAMLPGLGPRFATAKVRREAELVILADGTFAPDYAQQMLENIHMRQIASVDRAMSLEAQMHVQVQRTATLLTNIVAFVVVLAVAAVLLALFLGGGRAAVRVLRGKPAAVEPEFLSLHLEPQNQRPRFGQDERG
jgi:hypothetical protein